MGNCAGKKSQPSRRTFQQLPADIQNYNPKSNPGLERLSFQCELYNVKIMGNVESELSMKFCVEGIVEIVFPQKSIIENQTKWKTKGKFGIKGNQYDIRKLFLQIQLINQTKTVTGVLKINLYQIMSGPYHNDLKLRLSNNKYIRVVFDLKISQVVQLKLKSTKTKVQFLNPYPGDKFNYTIRAKIFSSEQIQQSLKNAQSAPSYTCSIPLISENNFRKLSQTEQMQRTLNSPLKKKLLKKVSNMIPVEIPSQLTWKREESDQMPSFKIKMKSSQLSTAVLQVTFWKVNLNEEKTGMAIQRFGEWVIFLVDILQANMGDVSQMNSKRGSICRDKEPQNINSSEIVSSEQFPHSPQLVSSRQLGNKNVSNRTLQIENPRSTKDANEKSNKNQLSLPHYTLGSGKSSVVKGQLFNGNGKVGTCQMEFEVSSTKYITQKHACARTEDGIVSMSPIEIYSLNQIKNGSFNKLCKSYDAIVNAQTAINDKAVRKSAKNWNKCVEVKFLLKQFLSTLKETHKDSLVYGAQKQLDQMLFRQQTLLNIANEIKEHIEDNENSLSDLSWRGELLLSNIGFKMSQQEQLQKGILSQGLKRKITIGLKYQQIIYTLLQIALSSGYSHYFGYGRHSSAQTSTNEDRKQDPREIFKVYCYLAVPVFRESFLKEITNNGLGDTGSSTDLDQRYRKSRNNSFLSLRTKPQQESLLMTLQYEQHFYKWLKQHSQSSNLNDELAQKLNNESWISYMASKNNGGFYSFVRALMTELQNYQDFVENPNFHYIPGYNKLVGSLLKSLEETPLEKYSADLCNAVISMLLNPQLLLSFLPIVLQKANIYSQTSVLKSLDLIQRFFEKVTKPSLNKTCIIDSETLPPVFLKSIRLLLGESDSVLSLCKTLELLYEYFPKFEKTFQLNLSLIFLGKLFNRLFYHWSYQVRVSFHHILILRIAQSEGLQDKQALKQRYEIVLRVIGNAEAVRLKEELLNQDKKKYSENKHVKGDVKKDVTKQQQDELWLIMRDKVAKKRRKLKHYQGGNTTIRKINKSEPFSIINQMGHRPHQQQIIRYKLQQAVESYGRRLSQDYGLAQLKRQTSIKFHIVNLKQKNKQLSSASYANGSLQYDNVQNSRRSANPKFQLGQEQNEELVEQASEAIFTLRHKASFLETNHIIDLTQVKQNSFMDLQTQETVNCEEYQLKQLLENQVAYILPATNQFRELNAAIERMVNQGVQIPDLDINTQIVYDKKDIRPLTIDKWGMQ